MMQSQPVPEAPRTIWIGIDVAKKTVDAALHLEGAQVPVATFPRTAAGMAQLCQWAVAEAPGDSRFRVVLEATGRYSTEAMAWLLEADPSIAPACVNPLHARRFAQSLGLRNKTDRADARMLARLGAERQPAPCEAPGKIVRERRELVAGQTRLKNRLGEGADSTFVVRERSRMLRNLGAAIKRLDAEIARVARLDEKFAADVKRLMTIPGVGFVTAVTVLAELGDLRRFASGRQLAAFAGLSPRRFESGTSVRGKTRLCKQGNPSVRAILYMSAVTTSRMEKGMKPVYDHLLANRKTPMAALGALMRRRPVLMRTLLVNDEDYQEPAEKISRKRENAVA